MLSWSWGTSCYICTRNICHKCLDKVRVPDGALADVQLGILARQVSTCYAAEEAQESHINTR